MKILSACCGAIAVICLAVQPTLSQNSDEQAGLARDLIAAIRVDQQVGRITELVALQTMQFMQQSRPNMPAEEAKAYGEAYASALRSRIGDLVTEITKVYAQEYSAEELKQIIAFYRSPVGQKYLDKAPALSQRAAALGQTWQQQVEQAAQSEAAQEMKKRGYKDW